MKKPTKQPLPLNYIRSFESAARNLSFTLAAEELGYTQAAISNHIRALEHYVGWQLFIRYPRSVRLTEMGEAFLPTLRQSLGEIDRATEAILAGTHRRKVVVSCPISLAENWLAALLVRFGDLHKDIDVVLHGTMWDAPFENQADISITVNRFDAAPKGSSRLWADELILLCSPVLAARLPPSPTAQDLAGIGWITVMGRQDNEHAVAQAIGMDEVGKVARLTTNATNIALEWAVEGAGLVVTQRSTARVYLSRGLLVEPIPTLSAPSSWGYYLTSNPLSRGSHIATLRDWLVMMGSPDGTEQASA
ncbi:LysR family transcriptional regulator [Xinfangfangia sp. CPCC 101601]|uniref:LysR family transcriptional regulator n=1 Tax=Pseudogemmobacter lacusdianii TaxID=3069608 RepID=A0ABU0W0S3_9RHOB|nr:LysR family transcriptional regulator [Xinfangfangia sp. CPCC 101601]MDQ2067617.1 LysR family transcriptional regulator [Xinfangfangia sp. CPCC 101601]